jgi:hypothetical protein
VLLVVVLVLEWREKLVQNRDLLSPERIRFGKEMLVRIVAMLTKLVERFDPYQYRVREAAVISNIVAAG